MSTAVVRYSTALPPSKYENLPMSRSARVASWLAAGWGFALVWWLSVNYTKVRALGGLITLKRSEGVALTRDAHLSSLPEIHAEMDALGLLGQNLLMWTLVLTAFALLGTAIGLSVFVIQAKHRQSIVIGMLVTWTAAVVCAGSQAETLDLMMWLTN
jgi:hypothetical protein